MATDISDSCNGGLATPYRMMQILAHSIRLGAALSAE